MMSTEISILERPMSSKEFEWMKKGFDENTLDQNVLIQSSSRFGFVAVRDGVFIGCASGLAYQNGQNYSGWFYLTDLFVDKDFRHKGIGSELLKALERKIFELGVRYIWTWTAGYEAPKFYQKQGYVIFSELENWYSDGGSRIGLRKNLEGND